MKTKKKRRTALLPLSEVIARDARNKRALETQFMSFYTQMKKTMRDKSELRNLEVPLEKIKESVKAVAHGVMFGIPMVTIEEPRDWEG
jgi:hypothetical protein